MICYCLGFAISTNEDAQTYVALIRKTKPEWQAGYLNGIGGKLEPEDCGSARHAMAREFFEETGLPNHYEWWVPFGEMRIEHRAPMEGVVVSLFALRLPWREFQTLSSPTEETVEKIRVDEVSEFTPLPNLAWLIPMAEAFLRNPGLPYLTIKTL